MHFPSAPIRESSPYPGSAPIPYPWQPKYLPEQWIYTDGSDIEGHPRLGAAVVHIPTATTIYIDAAGTDETRTIMRAELVAIYTALTTFASHEWIGIFHKLLNQPTGYPTLPHKPWYHWCQALSPPQPLVEWYHNTPRGKKKARAPHYSPQTAGPHPYKGQRPR